MDWEKNEQIKESPHIKDSGNRTKFESGAVRDIQEGKGRCDLLPLDVIAEWLCTHENGDLVFLSVKNFVEAGDLVYLKVALDKFRAQIGWDQPTLLLEVAKHFEEGALKYGERNWEKGIPVRCYIDSALRHYLKFLRGDTDEPHDRAFVWNVLCCMWTCKHKPELNEYKYKHEMKKGK